MIWFSLPQGSVAGGLGDPDRIFFGGFPYYFKEEQIRELVESFGPLRSFELVTDGGRGNNSVAAYCVYQDVSVTDIACHGLNGIRIGAQTLIARRANHGANQQPEPHSSSQVSSFVTFGLNFGIIRIFVKDSMSLPLPYCEVNRLRF